MKKREAKRKEELEMSSLDEFPSSCRRRQQQKKQKIQQSLHSHKK